MNLIKQLKQLKIVREYTYKCERESPMRNEPSRWINR